MIKKLILFTLIASLVYQTFGMNSMEYSIPDLLNKAHREILNANYQQAENTLIIALEIAKSAQLAQTDQVYKDLVTFYQYTLQDHYKALEYALDALEYKQAKDRFKNTTDWRQKIDELNKEIAVIETDAE